MSSPRPTHLLSIIVVAFAVTAVAYWVLVSGASRLDAPAPELVATVLPATALGGAPGAPVEEAPRVPIARIEIPSIAVDAAVETRTVTADGAMEDPTGPRDVAWYDFSALPNRVGNIVMSGHLDYVNVGAAVFYRLGRLEEGDEVVLTLVNDEVATYRVTRVDHYEADSAPVQEIVGPTAVETVTLITCGGRFDASVREYDERVIVRAERVAEQAAPGT